jgi:hypothetical protein
MYPHVTPVFRSPYGQKRPLWTRHPATGGPGVNWRKIAVTLIDLGTGVLSVNAFHEKAGPSQVSFLVLSLDMVFSPAESPLSPPFHPHSLRSDFVRSVQVGCSRYSRCCHLIFDLSSISRWKRARRLTQSPELGFGLLLFLSKNVFDFMLQPALLSAGCGAAVHTLLR